MDKPLFFEKNRVNRVYTGGKLFADFFSDDSEDGFFPEEWIASAVIAKNKEMFTEKDGVSKTTDGEYFDSLLEAHKTEMLGPTGKMRILVKILDSAVRLPAQAHPDKAFSRVHFNSNYGKEESWVILATRPDAKIFYGFKKGVTMEQFEKAIEESETSLTAMEELLESFPVKAGDIIYIPAKMVHAIGCGCLLLEVQEPTDFTIQPERWCGEYKLSDKEMYLGLDREKALECFDMDKKYPAPLTPKVISEADGVKYEAVIDETITTSFAVRTVTVEGGKFALGKGAAVYVVTEGEGSVIGENYNRELKKGDYFLLPEKAKDKYSVTGNYIKVTECFA